MLKFWFYKLKQYLYTLKILLVLKIFGIWSIPWREFMSLVVDQRNISCHLEHKIGY